MKRRGFTIVEMLVVVVIIALLASITYVVLSGVRKRFNEEFCVTHFRTLHTGFMLYREQQGASSTDFVGDIVLLGLPGLGRMPMKPNRWWGLTMTGSVRFESVAIANIRCLITSIFLG